MTKKKAEWIDQRKQNEVDEEMAALTTMLHTVSQMPKPKAKRMLLYCMSHMDDGAEANTTWSSNESLQQAIDCIVNRGK